MANINLSQSSLERKSQESNSIFDKGLMVPLGLLVLSFGTMFGVQMYNSFVEGQTTALEEDIKREMMNFEGDSVSRIADFTNRMDVIDKKLLTKDVSAQDMFASVESLMVNGVSLGSYEYDTIGRTLSLKIVASDFKGVAQQVMSFKSHKSFKGISVGGATRDQASSVVTSDVIISL